MVGSSLLELLEELALEEETLVTLEDELLEELEEALLEDELLFEEELVAEEEEAGSVSLDELDTDDAD